MSRHLSGRGVKFVFTFHGWGEKMSKSIAGAVLIAGLFAFFIGGTIASWAGGQVGSPLDDWKYDLIGYIGMAGAVAGIAMFAVGALNFARK